jgi:hypothetical protein
MHVYYRIQPLQKSEKKAETQSQFPHLQSHSDNNYWKKLSVGSKEPSTSFLNISGNKQTKTKQTSKQNRPKNDDPQEKGPQNSGVSTARYMILFSG